MRALASACTQTTKPTDTCRNIEQQNVTKQVKMRKIILLALVTGNLVCRLLSLFYIVERNEDMIFFIVMLLWPWLLDGAHPI